MAERRTSNKTLLLDPASPVYFAEEENDDILLRRRKRCPVHKLIRQQQWEKVCQHMQMDPKLISEVNGVGWSTLILAIYHEAPHRVIARMLDLTTTATAKVNLLATPVPNGQRLALHFAARYCHSLETIQILAESYKRALVARSDDGNRPLDRAVYYRKDATILKWLQDATEREEEAVRKETQSRLLQQEVRRCCYSLLRGRQQELETTTTPTTALVVRLYSYAREREMMGLFEQMVSYIGVG